jgi:hypothetical protein
VERNQAPGGQGKLARGLRERCKGHSQVAWVAASRSTSQPPTFHGSPQPHPSRGEQPPSLLQTPPPAGAASLPERPEATVALQTPPGGNSSLRDRENVLEH